MAAYTKKPVTIEAFRWTGGPDQEEDPVWICDAIREGTVQFVEAGFMSIQTAEGTMIASPGDWIIRGVEGELYPCKDSIFQATYAPESASLTGLPVSGYRPQSAEKVALANVNKLVEEQVLRTLDGLAGRTDIDKRWLAIGRTAIENGFMAVNRSVFQPSRVALPGDLSTDAVEAPPFAQDTRSRGEPRVPRHEPPAAA